MKELIWPLGRFITKNFFLRDVTIDVRGAIPKKAAILVANHDHAWDPPLIMIATKKITHFFTANTLFKSAIRKFFLKMFQQIPVEPGLGKLNKKAFSKASFCLKNNELVGIFPYPYDMVKRKRVLYTGVIRLMIENDAPVIPIKVRVYEKRKSKSFYDVNFDKALVIIGKPIRGFKHKCKKGMPQGHYLSLTKELMKSIDNLKC